MELNFTLAETKGEGKQATTLKVSAFHLPNCAIVITYPRLQKHATARRRGGKNPQHAIIREEKCSSEEIPNWHQRGLWV